MASVGEITATLRAKTDQWEADLKRASQSARDFGHEFARIAEDIGKVFLAYKAFAIVQGPLTAVASAFAATSTAVSRAIGVLPAFGIATAGAATAATAAVIAFHQVSKGMDEIAAAAKRASDLRLPTDDFLALERAARVAGASHDDLTASLKTVQTALLAARDPASEMGRIFKATGVDIDAGTVPAFLRLWDVIRQLPDGFVRDQLVAKAFGDEVGQRMLPSLLQSAAGLTAFQDATGQTKAALETASAASRENARNWAELGAQWQELRQAAAAPLTEAFANLRLEFGRLISGITLATPQGEQALVNFAHNVGAAFAIPEKAITALLAAFNKLPQVVVGNAFFGVGPGGGGPTPVPGPLSAHAVRSGEEQSSLEKAIAAALQAPTTAPGTSARDAREIAAGLAALRRQEFESRQAQGATLLELQQRITKASEAEIAAIRAKVDDAGKEYEIQAARLRLQNELFQLQQEENAAQAAFNEAQVTQSQNVVTDLESRLSIEQQQGATRKELLALAAQADAAEIAANQRAVAALQDQIDRQRELDNVSTASRAKIAGLEAEQERFIDALARGPSHVRALHQEFISLGDTLDGIFANFTAGLAFGTNKQGFSDFGKQAGEAFIGELIRSTIKEKGLFDFKIRSNLLELVGFAGDSGQQAGQGFVGGLVSKVGGLFGGGTTTGTGAVLQTTPGQAAGVSRLAAQGFGAADISALQAGALSGTEAGGLSGALGGIGGAVPIIGAIIAAIGIITDTIINVSKAVDAETHKFTLTNQSLATNASVQAAAFKQLPLLGTIFGGASGDVLSILNQSQIGRLAISAIFPGAALLQAPTPEHQVARSINELFVKAGVPRFQNTPFQESVYGRDIATILARSGGTPLAQALRAQGPQPGVEALRPIATDLGLNIFQGNTTRAAEFGNTVINNARALGLSAKDTKEQLLTLAKAAGVDLAGALSELNAQLLAGIIDQKAYHDAALGVASLLTTLAPAFDSAAIAAAAFDKATGRLSLDTLNQLMTDAGNIVGGALKTIFEQDLAGADAKTQAAAFGKTIGDAIVQGAEAAFLQKDLLGQFLTKGSTELTAAANEYIAGNVGAATKLRDQALKDIAKGTTDAQKFLGPFAAFINQTQNLLTNGGTTAPPSAALTGFNIPFFDTGGVLPRTGLYVGHAGEHIYPADQHDALAQGISQVIQLLTVLTNAPPNGDVNVEAVLTLDGRELDRAQIYNRRYRRAGMITPQQGLGIRG